VSDFDGIYWESLKKLNIFKLITVVENPRSGATPDWIIFLVLESLDLEKKNTVPLVYYR